VTIKAFNGAEDGLRPIQRWMYVCVYARTHTHCTDRVLVCEHRSRDDTSGGPKESEFPAQKCRTIKNCSHETESLSETVHGCRILPCLANNRCASQERATQCGDFPRSAAGKTSFFASLHSHEPYSLG